MSFHGNGSVSRRNNPFARPTSSSSSSPRIGTRPKSTTLTGQSPLSIADPAPSHTRSQSSTSPPLASSLLPVDKRHVRGDFRNGSLSSGTFAPSFIKSEEDSRSNDAVKGIEGENDFSGKRYVWLKDAKLAFVKGWIVEDVGRDRVLVQCEDGSVRPRELESKSRY
jgi:myosin heavy chain 9/10/11/14